MAKIVGLKFKESDYDDDDFIDDFDNDPYMTDDGEPDEEALAAEDEDYNREALMTDEELEDEIFAAEFEHENCWEDDEEELEDRGYEGASDDDSAYTIDEYGEYHN